MDNKLPKNKPNRLETLISWIKDIKIHEIDTYIDIISMPNKLSNPRHLFIRIAAWRPNNNTEKVSLQKGRKWYISPCATKSEVVLTAWMAYKAFLVHGAREKFTYKGKRIFDPHINVDGLALVAPLTDIREHNDHTGE